MLEFSINFIFRCFNFSVTFRNIVFHLLLSVHTTGVEIITLQCGSSNSILCFNCNKSSTVWLEFIFLMTLFVPTCRRTLSRCFFNKGAIYEYISEIVQPENALTSTFILFESLFSSMLFIIESDTIKVFIGHFRMFDCSLIRFTVESS